jgi:hypothetical protein
MSIFDILSLSFIRLSGSNRFFQGFPGFRGPEDEQGWILDVEEEEDWLACACVDLSHNKRR